MLSADLGHSAHNRPLGRSVLRSQAVENFDLPAAEQMLQLKKLPPLNFKNLKSPVPMTFGNFPKLRKDWAVQSVGVDQYVFIKKRQRPLGAEVENQPLGKKRKNLLLFFLRWYDHTQKLL